MPDNLIYNATGVTLPADGDGQRRAPSVDSKAPLTHYFVVMKSMLVGFSST